MVHKIDEDSHKSGLSPIDQGSKKKRSRRRKKKKKGEMVVEERESSKSMEVDEGVAEPAYSTEDLKLNPHALLCARVMAEGFTPDRINDAMEEMWNKNLRYDDFDAVLRYLNEFKGKSVSIHSETIRINRHDFRQGGVEESKEIDESESSCNSHVLEANLRVLVSQADIHDAIASLTSLVRELGMDPQSMFSDQNRKHVVCLIQRAITTGSGMDGFVQKTAPLIQEFMDSVLETVKVRTTNGSEISKVQEQILFIARKVWLAGGADSQSVIAAAAARLVSDLVRLLDKDRASTSSRLPEMNTIVDDLAGDGFHDAFQMQKSDLQKLQQQSNGQQSEDIEELTVAVEDLLDERQMIRQRIDELKKSIEKLEIYDAELCVKVDDARAQLASENALATVESHSTEARIAELTKILDYGTLISELAEAFQKYEGR